MCIRLIARSQTINGGRTISGLRGQWTVVRGRVSAIDKVS